MTPAEALDATPIRVLLADDHPVVRRGLAALLDTLDGIEVVAQAGTGEEAVREVGFSRPDVVVMDLRMPGVDGVEATRRIVKGYPKTAVLVLTMFDEDALVADALRAGARGYLLKRAEQAEIERAIRGSRLAMRSSAARSSAVCWAPSPSTAKLPRLPRSRRGNAKCSTSSPPERRTPPSPIASGSHRRQWAITSRRYS